jgi:hypothetical protein
MSYKNGQIKTDGDSYTKVNPQAWKQLMEEEEEVSV